MIVMTSPPEVTDRQLDEALDAWNREAATGRPTGVTDMEWMRKRMRAAMEAAGVAAPEPMPLTRDEVARAVRYFGSPEQHVEKLFEAALGSIGRHVTPTQLRAGLLAWSEARWGTDLPATVALRAGLGAAIA